MSAKLAADPDTPPEKLAKLAARFPGALLRNPVLPLLLLEQPDWLTGLSEAALLALMPQSLASPLRPLVLQAAAAHAAPLVRLLAAGQPDLPAEWLAPLQDDDDPRVQNLAAYRSGPPPTGADLHAAVEDTLRLGLPPITPLAGRAQEFLRASTALPNGLPAAALPWASAVLGPADYFALLARHATGQPLARLLELTAPLRNQPACTRTEILQRLVPFVAADELPALATNANPLVRELVARHPAVMPALLAQLVIDGDDDVCATVARLADTPPAVLARLAHPGGYASYIVAEHPALPPPVLAHLATDANKYMRCRVAANPATPIEQLAQLAHDPEQEVRQGVARNPAAPVALLVQLAADKQARWQVKWRVAQHPATPPDVLAGLAKGRRTKAQVWAREQVAQHAATPPATLTRLATDKAADVRTAAARHPDTPTAALVQLATDPEPLVRLGAARNPATPEPVATLLATDADGDVRHQVAQRADAAPALLARLATDEYHPVRRAVARHPTTPLATLAQLAADQQDDVAQLATTHPTYAPTAAIQQAAVAATQEPNLLTKLAWSELRHVRVAVAENPVVPASVLARLARDPAPTVVQAVARHPATPAAVLGKLALHPKAAVRTAALAHPGLPDTAVVTLLNEPMSQQWVLLSHAVGRRALMRGLAGRFPSACLLFHLIWPEDLTAAHRAALAASLYPAHRLSVAHLPEFQAQLRHDPHLLVRAVAATGKGA